MKKIFQKLLMVLIAVIALGFIFSEFGSATVRAQAQAACTVQSGFWYLQSSPNGAVTSGAPGQYVFNALFGSTCLNRQVNWRVDRNGSASPGATGSTRTDVSIGNAVLEFRTVYKATYKFCFSFDNGATYPTCGAELTMTSGPAIPAGPGAGGGSGGGGGPGAGGGAAPGAGGGTNDCKNLEKSIEFAAGKDPRFTGVLQMIPKMCTAGSLMSFILNIFFAFSGAIAVVFIMIGGYQLMISSGNAEGATQGKKTLTYAIIGLIVIVMAYALVNVTLQLLT